MDDLETCLMPMRLNEPKMEFEDDADSTLVMPALKTMQRSSQHHHDDADDSDDDEFEEKPTGKPKKNGSSRPSSSARYSCSSALCSASSCM